MLNSIENKARDILHKILDLVKCKERPNKKAKSLNFSFRVQEIISGLCNNSSNELFKILLEQFKEFINFDSYPNGLEEAKIVLKEFHKPGDERAT